MQTHTHKQRFKSESINIAREYNSDESGPGDDDIDKFEMVQHDVQMPLVSNDVLTALQRSLYEKQTPPALVALLTFSLRTAPNQKPSILLALFREKLNCHGELWDELRKYGEAMNPQAECLHQQNVGGNMYQRVDKSLTMVKDNNNQQYQMRQKTELCVMREFLSFVVTRLQV
jgi:hypothetical protein